jgi:hypothetical protein
VPQFVRLELWDKLQCQSGSKLAVLYTDDLSAAKDVHAIDDQESLAFTFTRYDDSGVLRPILSVLRARAIATVVWDDGSFDEWRVSLIDDGHGVGGLVTVTANPLLLDLTEGADSSTGKGLVSTTALCLRSYSFGVQALTAGQIWDTYIIPNCPSWVSRGNVDPSATIATLSWDRLTPYALALQVRDTLRKMNVSCEIRLRRNGTTGYYLDLTTQIGSGASVPLFYPRTNLSSLKRRIDTTQQATRVFVTGETDPSGSAGIPGRARWKVTNVDAGNKKLTLADPNGGTGPIGMANQWQNLWLVRCLTGRTFQIQASDDAAQTVTLLDLSTFATDELVEFRLSEPETNARIIPNDTRYAISSVASNTLSLSSNPIQDDGQFVDWYAKVWTTSTPGTGSVVGTPQRISSSTASTDQIVVASGSGFNNTQFVEFIQLDGAGEIPSYLDHATYVQAPATGYGMKASDLAISSELGITNLCKNAWMRTWSNSSNPPDGWFLVQNASPGSTSRNSNALFTRYGGFSYSVDWFHNFVRTPRIDPIFAAGNTRLSVRAYVYFDTFTAVGGDHSFDMKVWALTADGAGAGTFLGAVLGSNSVQPANGGGTQTKVATGAWVKMEVVGMDIGLDKAPYGIAIEFSDSLATSTGKTIAYLDTVEVYGFAANPDESHVYEFGDATVLHQAGNRQLVSNGAPPVAYELSIADLERQDPTVFSRNLLTLGGNVRAVDPELGVDTSVRLLRLERDILRPEASIVGLSNLPALLLQLVQTT